MDVPKDITECETCMEIIKTGDLTIEPDEFEYDVELLRNTDYLYNHEFYYKKFDFELGRPRLELSVYQPHVCCLSTLKKIQIYKDSGWISDELFDRWMSLNGGDYQLGRSGKIDWLWNERRVHLVPQNNLCVNPKDLIDINDLKKFPIYLHNCKKHQHIQHVEIQKCNMERSKVKILNKLFPFSSTADRKKTNVDLASIVSNACQSGEWEAVNNAFKLVPIGTHNCTAAAILIHSLGNKHFHLMKRIMWIDRACCLKPEILNKYFKNITTALRRTSRWPNGDIASLETVAMCSYWEQCLGRSNMLSDWDKEMANRLHIPLNLKPPLYRTRDEQSNERYLYGFNKSLDEIMEQLIPSTPRYTTFLEFCENRQSWLASGSSGGEQIIIDDKGVRINKRTYFESIPIETMATWIDDEPKMVAVASEKFEQSKARAIYGTKPKDYAIMAFAMMQAESNLYRVDGLEGGLVGSDEMRSILRRVELFNKDPNMEGLMLDYADFNIQHTLQAQADVFYSMKRRLLHLNVSGDIIKALDWCAKACLNQWVKFPNDPTEYKTIQGLFSGNRGTNFINTLCNLAYFKTANRWVNLNLNIKPSGLYNLHQGDDVWIAFKNRIWGIALYSVMKETGFIFQNEKQLQDRSRGEFLRVLYSHDGAQGYLARSIGTFLIRPLQGEDDVAPDARCSALNSQIMILSRRGLDDKTSKILWNATIRYAANSVLPSGATFTVPMKAIYRNFLDGGLDLGPPGTMVVRSEKIPPIPTIQFESPELFENVPRHTTNAWIKVISSKYKEKIDADALGDLLHKINTSDSLRPIDKQRALGLLHKQLRKWAIDIKEKPSVTRSYALWDEWLSRKVRIDPHLIESLHRQISLISIKRDLNVSRTRIETIISAISSSPFKDIASAERALHLGKIKSAKVAIKCSKNTVLSQEALAIMNHIEVQTSIQVLSRVISGVRGVGGTFEYKLHPIIMSWMNKVCLDRALNIAIHSQIRQINDWDDLLFDWQSMGMRCLLNCASITTISKY